MKLNIKILGVGCQRCKTLEKLVTEVVNENKFDAEISKIEDINKIMEYGVMLTPGLVINEKVLVSGRVPSKDEIKKLIEDHING